MIVLGVDPGIANIGWGVISVVQGREIHKGHGHIKTSKDDDLCTRLGHIQREITNLLLDWEPDYFCIEQFGVPRGGKAQFNTNVFRMPMSIGAMYAAIGNWVAVSGKPIGVMEFSAMEVKKWVAGHGHADKKDIQLAVKELLCLDSIPKPDHAADALAIAITGIRKSIDD